MDWMKDDGIFMPMLNDPGRNSFYQQALQQFAPGATVCDIGAGTGLLSVLAVKAGAKHVYAIERDGERCDYVRNMVDRLDLSKQITVFNEDFLQSDIRADVYVSETINTQIFGEDMIKLSNHVAGLGGRFIPSGFRIWAEVYADHPVFILDLSHSEACDFSPDIEIDKNFEQFISSDFAQQYNLRDTVYLANQLNRLFTMLPRFTDLRLEKLGQTPPIQIDLNQMVDESNIELCMPFELLQNQDNAVVVIKWQAFAGDAVLDSDQCWFGNVAKPIRRKFRTSDQITFRYDPAIKNWRLKY